MLAGILSVLSNQFKITFNETEKDLTITVALVDGYPPLQCNYVLTTVELDNCILGSEDLIIETIMTMVGQLESALRDLRRL